MLNLINLKTKKPSNYILRYWEKEFKQIKPRVINKRRYYSPDQVQVIKKIKFLLKDKGMTIIGVKKVLNSNKSLKLDVLPNNSINTDYSIINKLKKISNLIKQIKNLK